jgi:oligoribonuclease NrnB/cAMP/cGMP phosphodiesterase (DHH superfamily)
MDYSDGKIHDILCIHHDDWDGILSGAIVKRKYPNVCLYQMGYDDPVPWELINKSRKLIVVDFSLEREDMEKVLLSQNEFGHVLWIDHHEPKKGVYDWLDIESYTDYSGFKAGCYLAWEYFFPDEPLPLVVSCVSDRDLWNFRNPYTKAVVEYLNLKNYTALDMVWQYLLDPTEEDFVDEFVTQGQLLFDAKIARLTKAIKDNGFEGFFEGHKTLFINHPAEEASELGEIGRTFGFDIVYCFIDKVVEAVREDKSKYAQMIRKVSLRSIDSVDVAEIAIARGGGGHKKAAGFSIALREWKSNSWNGTGEREKVNE